MQKGSSEKNKTLKRKTETEIFQRRGLFKFLEIRKSESGLVLNITHMKAMKRILHI